MASLGSSAIDFNQPEISPYEQSRIIVVTIGNKNYSIPENYIQGQHRLSQARQSWNPRIILGDIAADIGHTVLHFLYKGEYETIAYGKIEAETHRVEIEYKRSLQVYYAARKYEIHGLDTLAQNYIMTLSESLSIFQILQGARLIFSRLPEDEKWFHDYLHSKLSSIFAIDETTFQLDEFYNEIVDDPALSKAVIRIVVKAFTTETLRLRNILESGTSGNMMNTEGGEPACKEPFPAPQSKDTSCPEVPCEEYRAGKSPSALYEERPCGEPPIEVAAIESEKGTPKVHHNNGDNDDWGWDLLRVKPKTEKRRKRLARKHAEWDMQV
ncbi:hypothetical protein BJX68DRAFT_267338 [Aspergillus pseudodeflectus]|uniref:BTB domain-containing protein n=1 Tax=Aspergillus pseudodeflectus TaxID=176178 RepID=A0ABR4K9N0_9EURO